ncbi:MULTISPECIES: cytochrome b [Duganella]|uniref:cytochrome b n=1 Tax=Duganella TaxID=75654 RepID=UPI0030E95FA6
MPTRYDPKTIRLHWLVVILLALVWGCAQIIDFFPKGPPKITVRSIHMGVGLLLGFVMLYRLWWRARHGERFSATGLLPFMSRLVHLSLYALILAEVILGLANVWGRGDVIFNLYKIPAFDPANRALKNQIEFIHATVADVILAVVGLHAAAALVHHFIRKDDVLRRMLPGRIEDSKVIDA